MSEIAIQFQNVSKYYPLYHHITGGMKSLLLHFPSAVQSFRKSRFEALKDISFEVYKGETFGIIGRNGAGKSTALGLIAGVVRPTSGRVMINGRISPLLELGAGFHPELSGRENILLNGVLLGQTRAQVMAKMEEIIEFSELGRFIEQPIRTYSSGMLTRLGFSVVAHLEPEILLVDEVLAVGDLGFQQKCYKVFEDFKRQGKTIVFVSHDLSTIEKFCDRVVWLRKGCIENHGCSRDVINAYTLVVGKHSV
jgi:lipopolysaccharide transport system ATP-binding protein